LHLLRALNNKLANLFNISLRHTSISVYIILHLCPTSAWQIVFYFICKHLADWLAFALFSYHFKSFQLGRNSIRVCCDSIWKPGYKFWYNKFHLGPLVLAFRFQGSWRSLRSTLAVLPGNGKSLAFLFCRCHSSGFERVKFGNWLKARLSCETVDLVAVMCRQLAQHLNCFCSGSRWVPIPSVVERVIHYVWHDWRICGGIKWDYGLELFHPIRPHKGFPHHSIPIPIPAFLAVLVIDLLAFSSQSLSSKSCVCDWVGGWLVTGCGAEISFKLVLRILLLSSSSHSAHCFKSPGQGDVLLAANSNTAYSCIIKLRQDRCE